MEAIEVRVVDRDAHLVPVAASASVVVRGTTTGVGAVVDGRLRQLLSTRSIASSVLERAALEAALRRDVVEACAPFEVDVVSVSLGAVEDPTGFLCHAAAVADAQASSASAGAVARVWAALAERESLAVQRVWAAWKAARLSEIQAVAAVDAAAARAAHASALAAATPMGDHGRVAAWRRSHQPVRHVATSGSPTTAWSTPRAACPTPSARR